VLLSAGKPQFTADIPLSGGPAAARSIYSITDQNSLQCCCLAAFIKEMNFDQFL